MGHYIWFPTPVYNIWYVSEFITKKSEVKLETENEIAKFERKKRQVERLIEAEQIKVITSEDLQNQLLDQR